MRTYIILIIALFTFPFKISGEGKFQITSLEGENVKIILEPDYVNNLLHIKLDSGDQICIREFTGLIHPTQIHKNFLIIPVKIRGGSGVAFQYTAIICVSKGKIYKSLYLMTLERDFDHLGNIIYEYKISSFEMKQKDREFLLSFKEILSENNKQIKNNYTLHFDNNLKVFYSKLLPLNGLFDIGSDSYSEGTKKVLFEKDKIFPAVEIMYKYYFINNSWYILDGERHLTKFSNHCAY